MADAEVATKLSPAAEGAAPSSTADSVEAPPPSTQPTDPPPPTVNGVPEPVSDALPAASSAVEETSSKSIGAPRIDVSDESEVTTTTTKYELHDKDAEIADRVAAALKAARLQVSNSHFCVYTVSQKNCANLFFAPCLSNINRFQ